mmetsp:Transcript_62998/g.172997  ORF Transcript_62998/g.172997 Transcript_62998/m.172997 type:complete len:323 (-) Transcript_62998:692-1660(-)
MPRKADAARHIEHARARAAQPFGRHTRGARDPAVVGAAVAGGPLVVLAGEPIKLGGEEARLRCERLHVEAAAEARHVPRVPVVVRVDPRRALLLRRDDGRPQLEPARRVWQRGVEHRRQREPQRREVAVAQRLGGARRSEPPARTPDGRDERHVLGAQLGAIERQTMAATERERRRGRRLGAQQLRPLGARRVREVDGREGALRACELDHHRVVRLEAQPAIQGRLLARRRAHEPLCAAGRLPGRDDLIDQRRLDAALAVLGAHVEPPDDTELDQPLPTVVVRARPLPQLGARAAHLRAAAVASNKRLILEPLPRARDERLR